MDLRSFFESTRAKAVERFFLRIGWGRGAARLLVSLLSLDGSLPQGAPTSPRLSNLLNYRLDVRLDAIARRNGAAYTRYADDLTFSFEADRPPVVRSFVHSVKNVVEDEGYRLHQKRKLQVRRRHRQLVT